VHGADSEWVLVGSGEFHLRIRDLQHDRSRHASRMPLAQDGDQHGLQDRPRLREALRLSGYHRLADVLEFKPFENGLPVQPESAQDALAA